MASPLARRSGARVLSNVRGSAVLVGRAMDRAAIASLFNEEARLVSIIGPGGMGKTHLATCFANEQLSAYTAPGDGGVWLVDLTSALSVAGFCAELASTLGMRLAATQDATALLHQIGRTLDRRGRILIVLDNFEALVSHADATIGKLMRLAPRARLLVTSRVALDVPGEHRWLLHGLELPPPGEAGSPPESLLRVESVDLFLRRARQVRPDLVVDDDLVRSIAAIASQLEGIPLALELAAARVAVLSPAQLVELLAAGRDDVLVRPREDGRHRSMRTVVADSFRLLDDHERAAFIACATFEGGFDLDAADAVMGRGTSLLGLLERLIAHSLVQLAAATEPGAPPRFSLYEVIREYAASELERSPQLGVELQERHAQWFASVAERLRAEAALTSPSAAYATLRAEHRNLLRAHATTTAMPHREQSATEALSLALAVDAIAAQGDLALRLEVLERTLAFARGAPDSTSAPAFAEVLIARGRVHAELGAFDAAMKDFDEALALSVLHRHRDAQAAVRIQLGALVEARGDTSAAREQLTAALAVITPARDRIAMVREAEARAALAHASRREGKLAEADAQIVASIGIYRALGNEEGLCSTVFEAGVLALFRQSYAAADDRFAEALALARKLGARQREAAVHTAQGTMEQERGNLQDARELHEAAVTIFRDGGNAYAEASTLYYLGGAYLEGGQSDDAEALLASAFGLVRTIGVPRYEALIAGARASLHAMKGHVHEAEALLDAASRAATKCETEPTLLATLAIHRLQLSLGSRSAVGPDAIVERARAIAGAHECDDPRFALRLLERAVQAAKAARSSSSTTDDALVVVAEGKAFRLPGAAAEVDLRRRLPLARILDALARRRVESPGGDAMRVEDILAAGWPEERVRYDAGANRVYVALAELRKLGLRDWLVSDAAGYRLATSRRVILGDRGP